MIRETKTRSIIKAVLYRIISVTSSFLILWLLFGIPSVALGAAIVVNLTSFIIYYTYERIWSRIKRGLVIGDQDNNA